MALQVVDRVRHRLNRFNAMQVTATAQVVTMGTIPVTIVVGWHKTYVPHPQIFLEVDFRDHIPPGPFTVHFDWGNGTDLTVNIFQKFIPQSLPPNFYGEGTYILTVTVTDIVTGEQGSASVTLSFAVPVTASLTATPTSGNAPLNVLFSTNFGGGFPNYDVSLDFGDGSASSQLTNRPAGSLNFPHTYTQLGTYTATLTVMDTLGSLTFGQTVSTFITIGVVSGLPSCPTFMVKSYQRATQLGLANIQKALETLAEKRGCSL